MKKHMKLPLLAGAALLMTLSGCGEASNTGGPFPTAAAATWNAQMAVKSLAAPAGNTVSAGTSGVVIASSFDKMPTSGGATGGASFALGGGHEAAFSGKTVQIAVTAAPLGDAAGRKFAVAYSTAKVGNSGWQEFDLKPGQQTYSFEYKVPEDPAKGKGNDFLGIISDTAGKGAAIELSKVTVAVK